MQNEYDKPTLYFQQGGYALSMGWIFWDVNRSACSSAHWGIISNNKK